MPWPEHTILLFAAQTTFTAQGKKPAGPTEDGLVRLQPEQPVRLAQTLVQHLLLPVAVSPRGRHGLHEVLLGLDVNDKVLLFYSMDACQHFLQEQLQP